MLTSVNLAFSVLSLCCVQVMRYAFSGGQATLELHRQLGADLTVDVAAQYLTFFLDDDKELADLLEVSG